MIPRIPDITCAKCNTPCSFITMHYEPLEEKHVILASCHGRVDKLELTRAQFEDNVVPRIMTAFKEDSCSETLPHSSRGSSVHSSTEDK